MHTRLLAAALPPLLLFALSACENVTQPLLPVPDDTMRSANTADPTRFVATVLPGGTMSSIVDAVLHLDGAGGVFGSVMHASGTDRAAKWTVDASGNVSDPVLLGTLPAPFDLADQYVMSVNSDRQVVIGYARNASTRETAGWVWGSGTMPVRLLAANATRVYPMAINAAGVIVGQIATTLDGVSGDWGAVWLPPYDAEPILLPRLEDYSLNSARGITEGGVITGWVRGKGVPDALVRWEIDAQGNVLSGPDRLHGIDHLLVGAVNQDLDVVGSYYGDGSFGPYLFRSDADQRIALGTLMGHARGSVRGVSERATDGGVHAVGSSYTTIISDERAVLWSVDLGNAVTGPLDLGLPEAAVISTRPRRSLAFVSAGAYSTNDQRWVVGWSKREDGAFFATLWQPAADDDAGEGDCNPHPRTGACRG
jgi:hypothetical protein